MYLLYLLITYHLTTKTNITQSKWIAWLTKLYVVLRWSAFSHTPKLVYQVIPNYLKTKLTNFYKQWTHSKALLISNFIHLIINFIRHNQSAVVIVTRCQVTRFFQYNLTLGMTSSTYMVMGTFLQSNSCYPMYFKNIN